MSKTGRSPTTVTTQKRTRVSEQERIESLASFKGEIRRTDPNLSSQEVDRRARFAAGLSSIDELQQESDLNMSDLPESRTKRAAKATGKAADRAAGAAGSAAGRAASTLNRSKAQKIIFGIMLLTVGAQLLSDIIVGRNRQIDVIPRRIFAGSLTGIMLMMLAVVLPKIAVSLTVLMALTTLLYQGRGLELLEKLVGRAGVEISEVPDKPEPPTFTPI